MQHAYDNNAAARLSGACNRESDHTGRGAQVLDHSARATDRAAKMGEETDNTKTQAAAAPVDLSDATAAATADSESLANTAARAGHFVSPPRGWPKVFSSKPLQQYVGRTLGARKAR